MGALWLVSLQSKQPFMPQAAEACFNSLTQSFAPARLSKSGWQGRVCEHVATCCIKAAATLGSVPVRLLQTGRKVETCLQTDVMCLMHPSAEAADLCVGACQAAEEWRKGGVPRRPRRSAARRDRQGQHALQHFRETCWHLLGCQASQGVELTSAIFMLSVLVLLTRWLMSQGWSCPDRPEHAAAGQL